MPLSFHLLCFTKPLCDSPADRPASPCLSTLSPSCSWPPCPPTSLCPKPAILRAQPQVLGDVPATKHKKHLLPFSCPQHSDPTMTSCKWCLKDRRHPLPSLNARFSILNPQTVPSPSTQVCSSSSPLVNSDL